MSASGHKRTNRCGPKSKFVRFSSSSGQTRLWLDCPLSAKSGLMQCSKNGLLFYHLVDAGEQREEER